MKMESNMRLLSREEKYPRIVEYKSFYLTYDKQVRNSKILASHPDKRNRNRSLALIIINNDNRDGVWHISLHKSNNQYFRNDRETSTLIYNESNNRSFNSLAIHEARKLLIRTKWYARNRRGDNWEDITKHVSIFFNGKRNKFEYRSGKLVRIDLGGGHAIASTEYEESENA